MPEAFDVPASGTIDYQYVILPHKFTEDRWVQTAEVRPGNRAVVHHVIAFIREPEVEMDARSRAGRLFVPERKGRATAAIRSDMLAGFAPGMPPIVLEPGQGRLIKAGFGYRLPASLHGQRQSRQDRTQVGHGLLQDSRQGARDLTLARRTTTSSRFRPAIRTTKWTPQFEISHEVKLTALLPHMHLRGKDFEYRADFPDRRNADHPARAALRLQLAALVRAGGGHRCCPRAPRSLARRISTIRRTIPTNPDPAKDSHSGAIRAGKR